MGASSNIKGIRDLRQDFDKKWDALQACKKAGVLFPKQIQEYFGLDGDEDRVLESKECYEDEKLTFNLEGKPGVKVWNAEMEDGFEVDLTKLPKDVTKIRFYTSY
ncbi:MAG: hypothetical protein V3U54_08490 [Thermodesulfobacteriota bacterium]